VGDQVRAEPGEQLLQGLLAACQQRVDVAAVGDAPPVAARLGELVAVQHRHLPVGRGIPLARANRQRLDRAAGIQRVPRTAGVRGGLPVLDDGQVLEVANVVWCTGFVPDFGWIDLPVFDQDGDAVHDRGIVGSEPGLYLLGLLFLSALSSPLVGGVGRDAEHIARQIASRRLLDRPKARVSA
jgi:hypothetical protein